MLVSPFVLSIYKYGGEEEWYINIVRCVKGIRY